MATKKPRVYKETERTIQLRNLWRAAADKDIRIPCGSKSSAILARFQLYNAVRAVRQDPMLDPALMRILETVQIRLEGEDSEIVVIGKSQTAAALEAAFEQLGIGKTEVVAGRAPDALDQEIAASLARMESMVPRRLKEAGDES